MIPFGEPSWALIGLFFYDRITGAISDNPVRSVRYLVIADGLIGGHKESPLCPTPVRLGFVMVAKNPVALDAVAAALMGFDIHKIPQIREAFLVNRYPLASFRPEEIEIIGLSDVTSIEDIYMRKQFVPCKPSREWKGPHRIYKGGEKCQ